MPIQIISGEPGERFRNETDRILWQFVCNFRNSCGRCIQLAGLVGPFWPTPLHRRCSCRSEIVPPGDLARPFVDYVAEVRGLDPAQQARVMGAANWRLVDSGTVPWDDVVTRGRIRSFREVVDRLDLQGPALVRAGIAPGIVTQALASTQTPGAQASDQARAFLVEVLTRQGFRVDGVRQEIKRDLARRIGLGPLTKPSAAPAPALAPVSLGRIASQAGAPTVAGVALYLGADLGPDDPLAPEANHEQLPVPELDPADDGPVLYR